MRIVKILFLCLSAWLPQLIFSQGMVDSMATAETKALYSNMKKLTGQGIMFGHQDDMAYGIYPDGTTWWNKDDWSDVKNVCNSYPALYGWELGWLEKDSSRNLDGVDFNRIKFWIKKGYRRGGVITISWHLTNPATSGSAWDASGSPVSKIVPGGTLNQKFKGWLDKLANFFSDLKGDSGEYIPVIFRPYHENSGNWFWWGTNASNEYYIKLWQFTVNYLRDSIGLHNLIYAYCTDVVRSSDNYLARYPGDDYVDILGIDNYQDVRYSSSKKLFLGILQMIVNLADSKNKIAALTETGYLGNPTSTWWTDIIFNPIENDSIAKKISYFLVWRNVKGQNCAPYPGEKSAANFLSMYRNPYSLFEDKLPKMYKENTSSFPSIITGFLPVNVFPDPAAELIHVKLPANELIVEYSIYDLAGKLMMHKLISDKREIAIGLHGLGTGSYFLTCKSREHVFAAKFMKR